MLKFNIFDFYSNIKYYIICAPIDLGGWRDLGGTLVRWDDDDVIV